MFSFNQLYTFDASYITPPIPQRMSPAKVNDGRSIEQTDFRCICGKIDDCFNGINSYSYT